MQSSQIVTFLSLLAPLAFAIPTGSSPPVDSNPQTVHLKLHGGPASYDLVFPADGTVYYTNNDLSVSIIDAFDFWAYDHCTFYTDGPQTLVQSFDAEGRQQITVGPPQPVRAVSCRGHCLTDFRKFFSYCLATLPNQCLCDKGKRKR